MYETGNKKLKMKQEWRIFKEEKLTDTALFSKDKVNRIKIRLMCHSEVSELTS